MNQHTLLEAEANYNELAPHQWRVLALLARGCSKAQIEKRLGYKPNSLSTILTQIAITLNLSRPTHANFIYAAQRALPHRKVIDVQEVRRTLQLAQKVSSAGSQKIIRQIAENLYIDLEEQPIER